ncbi:Phytochrome-like protein cph2 [compost metagenome]
MLLALGLALGLSRWLAHRFARYQQDIDAGQARLRAWAESDPLTQLPNRARLHARLAQAIGHAEQSGLQLALLFIDLDRFKNINDSLGHAVGDELLIQVARRLSGAVRASDTVSRLGGDEFVILLENLPHAEQAALVAKALLQATAGQYLVAGHELAVTPSIGIAVYPADGADAETLLKNADAAMYHAKAVGRNNFQFFTAAMNTRVSEHLDLENRLRQALERHELSLHYQPQYDLDSGRLSGCEALMRWHNPVLGQVPPDKFIPIAEDSGLILVLGEWALHEACRQAMAWQAQGLPALPVAVNVSAMQFRHADLADQVERALRDSGLPPRLLELELTESVLAENLEQVGATLARLKQLGVRLAMDDFGTGYSSLSYLKHFKLDTLKIDRSFVSDLPDFGDNAALAITIIGMARSLGMTCIAEGIEASAQEEFLRAHGCSRGQGYLFSRPLSAAAMTELLARRAALDAATAPAATTGTA